MDKIFLQRLFESHKACPTCPSPEEVTQIFKQLLGILFPDYSEETFQTLEQFEAYVKNTKKTPNTTNKSPNITKRTNKGLIFIFGVHLLIIGVFFVILKPWAILVFIWKVFVIFRAKKEGEFVFS